MMKKYLRWTFGTAVVAISASLAQPAAADLYVTQVGDGAAALSSASTAVFVQKFADAGGSPLSTIALPTTASGANLPLTTSGSATSEGFLALSTNGQYLTLGGYGDAPGTPSIAGTASSAVNRAVGRIDLSSLIVDTTTALSDASYSGNNIRSVASVDGTSFWISGNGSPSSGGGIRYATLGATTSTQLSSTPTNTRVAKIFNGQLYMSSASGMFLGVSEVGDNLPTESGQATTLLQGFPTANSHSSYDFWFKDADTVYVADDGSAANGGGIQKWTQTAGTWSLQYTLLNAGAATTGVRGLTGTVDGLGNAVLYATTTATNANQLITLTDTDASATATTLATAPANTAFRGVAFVGSTAPPLNNADFNGDNVVDGADFLIWQQGFGATGQPDKSTGDATGDGNVDGLDLDQWKLKFGGAPAVAAIGAVPEPASLTLAGVAAIFAASAVARRRG